MTYVIGLDLGNVNIMTSIIDGMDEDTRKGGTASEIIPPQRPMGIQSTFYYSETHGERLCEAAYSSILDERFRRNLLKLHLGEKFECDGVTFEYNYALKKVCEHALNKSLDELERKRHETTNLVSLAYPAVFLDPAKRKLKEIVESITLKNGMKVKVVGMISEPAAAALDYLATYSLGQCTVLVCDLGGGTYDLALVKANPDGEKDPSGYTKYYDCLNHNGINVGGHDFDDVIYSILLKCVDNPDERTKRRFINDSEKIKMELSDSDLTGVFLESGDISEIDRETFERESKNLLDRIIESTREMINNPLHPKPDLIVLTGGATKMPMIQKAIEDNFEEYKEKIIAHDPHCAISHGAARFGSERDLPAPIQMRTSYDYGIACLYGDGTKEGVRVMIPSGTRYPYQGEYVRFFTHSIIQVGAMVQIYQAETPRIKHIKGYEDHHDMYDIEDFKKIIEKEYEFEKMVFVGTPIESKMVIDADGIMHVFVREPDRVEKEIGFIAGDIKSK